MFMNGASGETMEQLLKNAGMRSLNKHITYYIHNNIINNLLYIITYTYILIHISQLIN